MNVLKLLNGMKKNKEIDVNQIVGVELLNGKKCMSVMFDEFALDYNGESTVVAGVATVDQIVEANKLMKKYIKTMNDVLSGKEIVNTVTTPTSVSKSNVETPKADPVTTSASVEVPTQAAPVVGQKTKRDDWFTLSQWGKISKENKEILKAHFKGGTMTVEIQQQILSFIDAAKNETKEELKPEVPATPELDIPSLETPTEGSLEIPQLAGLN